MAGSDLGVGKFGEGGRALLTWLLGGLGAPTRAGTTEPGRLLCVPWPVPGLVHERGLLVAGSGDG